MSPVPEDDKDPVGEDLEIVENMEFPDVIMPSGPSDSDDLEDDDQIGGYELLPQEPGDITVTSAYDSDVEIVESDLSGSNTSNQYWRTSGPANSQQPHLSQYPDGCAPSYLQVSELPKPDKKNLLWNQEAAKTSDAIKMNEDQAAEIKAAMAGFHLPLSHVPEWAKNVSDEQWKEKIVSKIMSPQNQEQMSPNSINQLSHSQTRTNTDPS